MKKILLPILFLCCFGTFSFAQDLSPSAEKRVNFLTRVMATSLGLNESEYIRLKALNRERIVKSDEIAELYSNDQELQNKKLAELEESFDKKLRAMLSPSQLATYAAYKKSPDTELALSGTGNSPAGSEQDK